MISEEKIPIHPLKFALFLAIGIGMLSLPKFVMGDTVENPTPPFTVGGYDEVSNAECAAIYECIGYTVGVPQWLTESGALWTTVPTHYFSWLVKPEVEGTTAIITNKIEHSSSLSLAGSLEASATGIVTVEEDLVLVKAKETAEITVGIQLTTEGSIQFTSSRTSQVSLASTSTVDAKDDAFGYEGLVHVWVIPVSYNWKFGGQYFDVNKFEVRVKVYDTRNAVLSVTEYDFNCDDPYLSGLQCTTVTTSYWHYHRSGLFGGYRHYHSYTSTTNTQYPIQLAKYQNRLNEELGTYVRDRTLFTLSGTEVSEYSYQASFSSTASYSVTIFTAIEVSGEFSGGILVSETVEVKLNVKASITLSGSSTSTNYIGNTFTIGDEPLNGYGSSKILRDGSVFVRYD